MYFKLNSHLFHGSWGVIYRFALSAFIYAASDLLSCVAIVANPAIVSSLSILYRPDVVYNFAYIFLSCDFDTKRGIAGSQ